MLPTKFWFIWQSDFRGADFFRKQPIRNKNCLWGPCLLTDREGMSNLYKGPSIDASYQVSDHLARRFQRRCFEIDQSETRIACVGHIYQLIGTKWPLFIERIAHRCFLPMAKWFQRRFLEIDQSEKKLTVAAMFVNGSGRNAHSL